MYLLPSPQKAQISGCHTFSDAEIDQTLLGVVLLMRPLSYAQQSFAWGLAPADDHI